MWFIVHDAVDSAVGRRPSPSHPLMDTSMAPKPKQNPLAYLMHRVDAFLDDACHSHVIGHCSVDVFGNPY